MSRVPAPLNVTALLDAAPAAAEVKTPNSPDAPPRLQRARKVAWSCEGVGKLADDSASAPPAQARKTSESSTASGDPVALSSPPVEKTARLSGLVGFVMPMPLLENSTVTGIDDGDDETRRLPRCSTTFGSFHSSRSNVEYFPNVRQPPAPTAASSAQMSSPLNDNPPRVVDNTAKHAEKQATPENNSIQKNDARRTPIGPGPLVSGVQVQVPQHVVIEDPCFTVKLILFLCSASGFFAGVFFKLCADNQLGDKAGAQCAQWPYAKNSAGYPTAIVVGVATAAAVGMLLYGVRMSACCKRDASATEPTSETAPLLRR